MLPRAKLAGILETERGARMDRPREPCHYVNGNGSPCYRDAVASALRTRTPYCDSHLGKVTNVPTLRSKLNADSLKRSGVSSKSVDLTPYQDIIRDVRSTGDMGADVDIAADESIRVEKRRFTAAAKTMGERIAYRSNAPEGVIRFVLPGNDGKFPGERAKRQSKPSSETKARIGKVA